MNPKELDALNALLEKSFADFDALIRMCKDIRNHPVQLVRASEITSQYNREMHRKLMQKPKFPTGGPISQDLIQAACEAEEMFELDELERYADEHRRKTE